MFIVFNKGGVAVDLPSEALAEQKFSVRNVECRSDLRPGSSLQAMIRPERLGAIWHLHRVGERRHPMGAGEAYMSPRVPVGRQQHVVELACQGIYAGDDGIAIRNRQRSAGQKVRLHVDHEKSVSGPKCQHGMSFLSVETPVPILDSLYDE